MRLAGCGGAFLLLALLALVPFSTALAQPSATPPALPGPSMSTPTPSSSVATSARRTTRKAELREVTVEGECLAESSGSVGVSADLNDFGGRELGWELIGPAGVVASGRLDWVEDPDPDEAFYDDLSLEVSPGHYRIVITSIDEDRVVVDHTFDVAACITAAAGCHAVTFTNPVGNPSVRVRWDAAQSEDWPDQEPADPGEVIVEPGESTTVPVFWFEIAWWAFAPADSPESDTPNAGEHYSETPNQHCGPTMTRAVVRCGPDGHGTVEASLSPASDRGLRWSVIAEMEEGVLARGRVGADHRVRFPIRDGSYYVFRSYTAEGSQPYDQAWFDVPPCAVTATQTCRAVRFANTSERAVTIAYRRSGSEEARVSIRAGKEITIRVLPGTLTWRAASYPSEQESGQLWRMRPGQGSVRIDSTCSSDRPGNDRLPNTGDSVHSTVGLIGLASTIGGAALLARPRRRAQRRSA